MTSQMRSAQTFNRTGIVDFSTPQLTLDAANVNASSQAVHGVLHLIEPQHTQRAPLQRFIADGFATHYQAHVTQFMPHLLGVALADIWQAALGIRFASATLFTEQYLSAPAEQILQQHNIACLRSGIAEIGHLYAQNRQALMQLFVLMVQALYQLNIQQLLFAATADLKRLLTRHGIALTEVADATADCLGDKAAEWGSYYQSKPKVCVLSVAQAAGRIQADPRLQQLIFRHWPQLHTLVDTLKEAQ
ncbi:thermostable hemolysin [Rheinheimera baltica]|uniref:thermostable hemolysin n=1 Tax=Rheinheimera baltica TaxID=67576 RepID=UPI00273DDB7B|nr:thermostable hemolysin [Rheinheimera baltica]MDP5149092.1 thermostable hemolysin [Rheinheimera baltica]